MPQERLWHTKVLGFDERHRKKQVVVQGIVAGKELFGLAAGLHMARVGCWIFCNNAQRVNTLREDIENAHTLAYPHAGKARAVACAVHVPGL